MKVISDRIGSVDKLILDTKQCSERQIKLKAALKVQEDFNETQAEINSETKQRINSVKADLLSLRNTCVTKETIKSVFEKETREYADEQAKELQKQINQIKEVNKDLSDHVDDLKDKSSLINKKTSEISEKLENMDKLILDTKLMAEKHRYLKGFCDS